MDYRLARPDAVALGYCKSLNGYSRLEARKDLIVTERAIEGPRTNDGWCNAGSGRAQHWPCLIDLSFLQPHVWRASVDLS